MRGEQPQCARLGICGSVIIEVRGLTGPSIRRRQLRPSRKGVGDVSERSGLLLLESEPAVVEPPLPH